MLCPDNMAFLDIFDILPTILINERIIKHLLSVGVLIILLNKGMSLWRKLKWFISYIYDDLNLWHFNLRLLELTEFWNILDLNRHAGLNRHTEVEHLCS